MATCGAGNLWRRVQGDYLIELGLIHAPPRVTVEGWFGASSDARSVISSPSGVTVTLTFIDCPRDSACCPRRRLPRGGWAVTLCDEHAAYFGYRREEAC